jgi:hypothetical protein
MQQNAEDAKNKCAQFDKHYRQITANISFEASI